MWADERSAARRDSGRGRRSGRRDSGHIGRSRCIGVLHRNQDADNREPRNPSRTPRHHHGEGILPLKIRLGLVGEPGSFQRHIPGGRRGHYPDVLTSPTRNPPMQLRPATIRIDQSTLSDERPYLLTVSWHGCARRAANSEQQQGERTDNVCQPHPAFLQFNCVTVASLCDTMTPAQMKCKGVSSV